MSAKCPKCEGTEFSIEQREDKVFCYVVCNKCSSIVGVLENIDFKKKNSTDTTRYDKIIQNHGFFENRINQLENELKELKRQNNTVLEMVEITNNNVYKILKNVR